MSQHDDTSVKAVYLSPHPIKWHMRSPITLNIHFDHFWAFPNRKLFFSLCTECASCREVTCNYISIQFLIKLLLMISMRIDIPWLNDCYDSCQMAVVQLQLTFLREDFYFPVCLYQCDLMDPYLCNG